MLISNIVKSAIKEKISPKKKPIQDTRQKAAIIFGAGAHPGIGAAVAMRCALNGLKVYVTGRNRLKLDSTVAIINLACGKAQDHEAEALEVDVTDALAIDRAFAKADADGYCVDLVVHNVGTNRMQSFLDLKPEHLEKGWRADCLSGFLVGQAAMHTFLPRAGGTLIFTGASASLRGKAKFGQFSANKAGLRIAAQAMAREFGPKGIHVAHVIIDGTVDGARLRDLAPQFLESKGLEGNLSPDAIADNYWMLYQQHQSAWTHELDLRPAAENW